MRHVLVMSAFTPLLMSPLEFSVTRQAKGSHADADTGAMPSALLLGCYALRHFRDRLN